MCRSESWLSKWLALATSLCHTVLIRPTPPNCISQAEETIKLLQSSLSSCLQNNTTPRDFAAKCCEVMNGDVKHKPLSILPSKDGSEKARRAPTGNESIVICSTGFNTHKSCRTILRSLCPSWLDTLHFGLLRLKITQVILHDNQTGAIFPPTWHLYDQNGRCK